MRRRGRILHRRVRNEETYVLGLRACMPPWNAVNPHLPHEDARELPVRVREMRVPSLQSEETETGLICGSNC